MAKGHLNVGHKQLRLRATNSSSQHDAVTAQTRPNDAPARERVTTRLGLGFSSLLPYPRAIDKEGWFIAPSGSLHILFIPI